MRKLAWIPILFVPLLALGGFWSPAAGAPPLQVATIAPSIFIQSPREGQALQGVEIIEGKIRGEGFVAGKISFSYTSSTAEEPTWFFIADILPLSEDSSQTSFSVQWDTALITDGNYNLRLVAQYQGKASIFELIPNLRIRNHSPVETSTPLPAETGAAALLTPTATFEAVLKNTPSTLPDNPVVLKSTSLSRALLAGGIAVAALFLVGGIYYRVKNRLD